MRKRPVSRAVLASGWRWHFHWEPADWWIGAYWQRKTQEGGGPPGQHRLAGLWPRTVESLHRRRAVCATPPAAGARLAGAGLWTPDPDPDYPEEPNWDGWYALPAAERWRLGMAALQAAPARGLELTPDDWDDYVVGDGVTGFDLRAWAVGLLPPPQGRS